MAGYTRVDTINNIADGNVINAADLDGEFDGIQAAFNSSTGHNHDGTAGEGAPILALGPVQDVTISTTVLGVKTTNTVDLGTTGLRFKDFYLAGNASLAGNTTLGDASSDAVTVNGTITSDLIFTDNTYDIGASGATRPRNLFLAGNATVAGNTTIGDADTDTITQAASYVTGTQLKSAKTATNTLSLAAYDVDGTAYTDLITLTASNTPTLALTSTGVGTINNMSIGATTASTGAFTTLSSTGNTTLGDASTDTVTVNGTTTFNASPIISVTDNTNAALRITQLGTGNALLVEDSSNPDSSPFVITASGDVGIGTSSPARRLQVSNTSGDSYIGIEASNANISGILFADPDDNNIGRLSYDHATDSLQSWTNNQERMRIDSAGNVGIGRVPTASDTWAGGSAIPILDIAKSAGFPVILSKGYSTTANQGGLLVLAHSKSATVGTQTATANGDTFGSISFEGVNSSSAAASGGYIQAIQDSTAGATYIPSALTFYTGTNALAPAERLRIDSSGNMGLGVTPSAWSIKALQVSSTSLSSDSNDAYLTANGFFDGSWKYINTDFATQYYQVSGTHVWRYAASGTAGNAISFTTAMTIDSSGNVGIGATSPVGKLNVVGGTTGGTSFDTAVLVGGASGVAGSGAKLYLSGASTAPTARAAVIEGVSSGTANAHDMVFSTNAGGATPTERMRIDSTGAAIFTPAAGTGAVFNEGGVDADFRVESDTDSNAFFVRGSDGYVGIGTGSPTSLFTVNGESNIGQVVFKQNVSAYTTGLSNPVIARASGFTGVYNSGSLLLQARSDAAADIAFITGTTPAERLRINSSGNVGIGTDSPVATLDVNGTIVTRAAGGEGGQVSFNNPDNASVGLTVDVSSADTARVFQTRNNSVMQIGQLSGTGGIVTLHTAAAERMRIDTSGNVLVTNAASLGYGTGAGGTVTQATSKVTAVTLNKPTGRITMNNAALAAGASVIFALTNSLVAATDTVILSHSATAGTANAYATQCLTCGAGSVTIRVTNITAGSLSEAATINFAIIKGATS